MWQFFPANTKMPMEEFHFEWLIAVQSNVMISDPLMGFQNQIYSVMFRGMVEMVKHVHKARRSVFEGGHTAG
jgi:hypothetical protein